MTEHSFSRGACKHCIYFQLNGQAGGSCHRFPPAFAGESSPREDHHWRFPIVSELSWCGEFVASSGVVR